MDEPCKFQKKTASSSPNEDSNKILEKIHLLEERIDRVEEQGNVLAHEVSRSSKSKLQSTHLGYSAGHTAGFNLMRDYAKKVSPEGNWDDVDPIKARDVVGP